MKLTATLSGLVLLCAGCGGGSIPADTGTAPAALPQAIPSAKQAQASAISAAAISNDQLMDWAEGHLPTLFPGHAATGSGSGFVYRYYTSANSLIAVADNGAVAVVLPNTGNKLAYLGSAGQFYCPINTGVTCRPVTPIGASTAGPWPVANYAVRNDTEWAQAWASRDPFLGPYPERPAVDFSKNMVIGVSLGFGGVCGNFAIVRLVEESNALRAEYAVWYSLPAPVVCPAIAAPINSFVVTPTTGKPVYFVAVDK